MSNRVIEYDKTFVLTVQNDHGSKEFTKGDGVTGSIQTVTVTLESGNRTILKLWSKENFPFLPKYLIKINHCNLVEEIWDEKAFVNIHSTFDSQIEYPYTRKKTEESFAPKPLIQPATKDMDLQILNNRLDNIFESLKYLQDKMDVLNERLLNIEVQIVKPVKDRKF